jgi:histidinol-phosphate aminotransferase
MAAEDIIKLASNENPLGPSPAAIAAMQRMIGQVHLYPDGNAFYLKRALAQQLQLGPEHLILGNGSNEIIEFAGHALLAPGTEVVVSQYCFAVYPIVTRLFGADLVTVPAREFGHDLDAMRRAITDRTRIVFVANPNNPTGTWAAHDELRRLLAGVPLHVLLVMDEAYIEFLDQPLDLLSDVRAGTFENLLLMRTFSKLHGLAGLRLGYGIASPSLIRQLERVRQPFNTNALAQVAALAALADHDHVRRTRENNRIGLETLARGFDELGLEYVPSAANFILVRVGHAAAIDAALQRLSVITRPMAGYDLPEWLRISVGTPAENQRALAALRQALAR